jgi:hypothetical protein
MSILDNKYIIISIIIVFLVLLYKMREKFGVVGTATRVTRAEQTNNSESKSSCFAGSQLVLLKNGKYIPISEVMIGDYILTANKNRELSFSPVRFLPHKKNNTYTTFIEIKSNKNKILKLTENHSILVNNKMIFASSIKLNDKILTIDGEEIITEINIIKDYGIYTAITENEFIVVNNIIVSSISEVPHDFGVHFYSLLNKVYNFNPKISDFIHTNVHNMYDLVSV